LVLTKLATKACIICKGETTDLDHSKLKINHVNSTESLKIIMNHLNSSRVTRTHDRSFELSEIVSYI
jgi:hypothetical protein